MKRRVENLEFDYIVDNSKEVDENSAFLLTKLSKKYLEDAKSKNPKSIITPKDLYAIFDLDIKIVGVTGTNGKTTTTAAIYSILLDLGFKVALLGTRGFFINEEKIKPKGLTTPSLFELYLDIAKAKDCGCDFFVMEVSSHAIDQERIEGLKFALKVHTNITSDHLDYHKSLENYIATKNSFFADDSFKLVNRDDKNIEPNIKNTLTYGIENPASFKVSAFTLKDGIDARFEHFLENGYIHSQIFGKHNLYNLLAAISSVKMLTQKPLEEICSASENFGGVFGRCEIVSKEPFVVIDFAHTEDGMRRIFESFPNRDISVVFGAGGDRDRTKRALMGRVADRFAKRIYVTSDNPRSEDPFEICKDIAKGIEINKDAKIVIDRKRAVEIAIEELKKDEVLLILGKGDEEFTEINGEKIYITDREIVERVLKENEDIRSKNEI